MTQKDRLIDTLEWRPDELGADFQRTDLDLGCDPEGEGQAIATLVRRLPDTPTGKPAILWVHGMTDYFFQAHVAEHFLAQGHPFYALDLRKCGRARLEGQRWHYVKDLAQYFPELTRATEILVSAHEGIVPLCHSTGGLIVPLWADHLQRKNPQLHESIEGLILNSPWLDMQFPDWFVRVLTPIVKVVGKRWPNIAVPGGNLRTYGESIHKSEHGEWDFDLEKKPIGGHPKYLGWLRTIVGNQKRIHRGEIDAGVPILTLCSSHSYLAKPYSPAADTADTVLDVDQIQRWAPRLSDDVRLRKIEGARHDVFLSLPDARKKAFAVADEWLDELA